MQTHTFNKVTPKSKIKIKEREKINRIRRYAILEHSPKNNVHTTWIRIFIYPFSFDLSIETILS